MSKRYSVKRGRRSACEYDVLIYDSTLLIFRGSFCNSGKDNLTKCERAVIDAIRAGVEGLNMEGKDED